MMGSRLQDYREDDPTWGFVAQLGAEQYTGEVRLGTTVRVHLYVDEGSIYFAEREGEAALQSRLVVNGALTPAQLARGGVFVDGSVSLARLFTRDTSIDRAAVEAAVVRFTEELLDEVGPLPVGRVELVPLHHHDLGVHEWAKRLQPPALRTVPAAPLPVRPVVSNAPLTISIPPAVEMPAPVAIEPATDEHAAAPAPLDAPEAAAPPADIPAPPLDAPEPLLAPPPLATVPLAAPTADAEPTVASPFGTTPFGAPPVDAAPAPLPAPPLGAAPADAPALPEPAPMAPALPRLADRAMSVAEIAAAQAKDTGEEPTGPPADRYAPADLSGLELPKLASTSLSVSELAARLEAGPEADTTPATEGDADHTDAGPSVATGDTIDEQADETPAAPLGLPTLGFGPPAVDETAIDEPAVEDDTTSISDLLADSIAESVIHPPAAEEPTAVVEREVVPIAPWATPAQNLAAVEIWEMVDEMLAAEQSESELVTSGAPEEPSGGRRRRSRKG